MDGQEIDRVTAGIEPLTDSYPKRLTDVPADEKASHELAWPFMKGTEASRRFLSSSLTERIWPEALKTSLEPFFIIREMRYRASVSKTNWLAELDIHLRGSRLRAPVLDVLETNAFRVALAEKYAVNLQPAPAEALPDLIAAALARRDFRGAIQLLEDKRARGFAHRNDIFLLTYLYCLNGNVDKAESLAAVTTGSDRKDAFAEWLWGKLQAEYGFRPPR